MDTEERAEKIIWAFGRRSIYAHAYCGEKALEKHETLCGINCVPKVPLEHWDIDNEVVAKITCPKCRERLPYVRFMALKSSTDKDGTNPE